MSRMESGVTTPAPVEKSENAAERRILDNIPEHYHDTVREFLGEPHEFGLALKIHGSKKTAIVRDSFEKLGFRVRTGEHRSYQEKKGDIHNLSVISTEFTGIS